MTEYLSNFKFAPYQQFVFLLSVLAAFVTILNPFAFNNLLIVLSTSIIFFIVFKNIVPSKNKSIWSLLASSLIVYLVWHPNNTLEGYILTFSVVILALLLKYFAQVQAMSIFNPAAFSLLAIGLLNSYFGIADLSFISWWGSSFGGVLSLIILFIWIVFGLKKWNKHYLALTFLLTYFALAGFVHEFDVLSEMLLNSTYYFLAAVMLIDPKSSPMVKNQQIYFGIFSGILLLTLNYFGITYAEILTILILNLTFWITRKLVQ